MEQSRINPGAAEAVGGGVGQIEPPRLSKPLLSMSETAQYLGVGKQSVYQMAAEGKLPVVRLTRGKRTIKVIRSILDDVVSRGLLGSILPSPYDAVPRNRA